MNFRYNLLLLTSIMNRIEYDFLGECKLPEDSLYGIHSVRARENFPCPSPFHVEWYQALGMVKNACYLSVLELYKAMEADNLGHKLERRIPFEKLTVLIEASGEVWGGMHFNHFIVPAMQGGAGTSINMNTNEIISNVALKKLGYKPGSYSQIDPIEDANIYQSTNDVVPTALKVATMQLLMKLEGAINTLRERIEEKEKEYRTVPRMGYTQMQAAVPSTWGQLFSTYSDMLSRDWWRVSKCFERIKVVNLGGGAVGTGIATPRFFIMDVVSKLQKLSGFPVTRSENLNDTTANLDSLVEVHAILKAHAVNLEKIASDIRLLGSDLSGNHLILPKRQVGSSIMPSKVNPVISEYTISVAHKVYSNDLLISNLCGQGNIDLNAYTPVIGNALLESIKLLIGACMSMSEHLVSGLVVNIEKARSNVFSSPTLTTALLPAIGYKAANGIAQLMISEGINIFEAIKRAGFADNQRVQDLLNPENLVKLGFSVKE